jgi:hypothetical protein
MIDLVLSSGRRGKGYRMWRRDGHRLARSSAVGLDAAEAVVLVGEAVLP